ncbi:MAG: pyridoxine 5'-phosphate synthase [bacterium]|nr:pyridoxine 5'-phosphate synthase [bacterium]
MIKLGVNIDHIATLRQARGGVEPDPVAGAIIAELSGANGITVHLREDRRHIQDRDIRLLREIVQTKLNLEMAVSNEIIRIALITKPEQCTLVPEKREELTTEGGLDCVKNFDKIYNAVKKLSKGKISVSLFIDPDPEQIKKASITGAEFIELHTGNYANAKKEKDIKRELQKLKDCTALAKKSGLRVNAGHGLNYINVKPITQIPGIEELNIGHSIISRSVLVGLDKAVREMKEMLK